MTYSFSHVQTDVRRVYQLGYICLSTDLKLSALRSQDDHEI